MEAQHLYIRRKLEGWKMHGCPNWSSEKGAVQHEAGPLLGRDCTVETVVALTVTEFVVCSALAQWHGM